MRSGRLFFLLLRSVFFRCKNVLVNLFRFVSHFYNSAIVRFNSFRVFISFQIDGAACFLGVLAKLPFGWVPKRGRDRKVA